LRSSTRRAARRRRRPSATSREAGGVPSRLFALVRFSAKRCGDERGDFIRGGDVEPAPVPDFVNGAAPRGFGGRISHVLYPNEKHEFVSAMIRAWSVPDCCSAGVRRPRPVAWATRSPRRWPGRSRRRMSSASIVSVVSRRASLGGCPADPTSGWPRNRISPPASSTMGLAVRYAAS
jgi:hypothetical protein